MKTDMVKLVTFQLGDDLFAADVFSVERVLRYSAPSSVPDVPPWIMGVLEHRDKVIPVVDMRRRVELPPLEATPDTRILIYAAKDGCIAAIVDAVHEVASVPSTAVSPPPALFRGLSARFLRGIVRREGRLIIYLDVAALLTTVERLTLALPTPNDG